MTYENMSQIKKIQRKRAQSRNFIGGKIWRSFLRK